jgi:amino acid transporter
MQKSRLTQNRVNQPSSIVSQGSQLSPATAQLDASSLKPSSFHAFLWPYIAMLIFTVVAVIGLNGYSRSDRDIGAVFLVLTVITALWVCIYGAIVLHRAWRTLQGSTARTTPGKAVGYLFIPFFGLYWVFQAYHGWAKDYNQHLVSQGLDQPDKRASEGLFLATCILMVCGIIPILGLVAQFVGIIFGLITFSQLIRGTNYLVLGK